ncbi:MAG: hypothetical protein LBD02_01035 [Christensenellaceae bacterium]|jgi:hypothetical protein|nr:hypothetical protein [Christensenellaceae bacterium]
MKTYPTKRRRNGTHESNSLVTTAWLTLPVTLLGLLLLFLSNWHNIHPNVVDLIGRLMG